MGLNTVDTYVPWNFHEPSPGRYLFDGLRNIERFLVDAANAGLYAIVRPGPYICSEWDNGGLPAWLLRDGDRHLRCSDERFMRPLDRWFDQLVPRLVQHQISAGGNVIAIQLENDYARYGSDLCYMELLRDGLRRRGIEVPLYVCETPSEVGAGTDGLAGVVGSVWLESQPEQNMAALSNQRPQDPPFCSELVCGPIQHWGEPLRIRDAGLCADMLDRLVRSGASISLYMAHGGTNFGLWNGANISNGKYLPAVTSYDYDSPISEQGLPTEKYWLFQKILGGAKSSTPALTIEPPATLPFGTIEMSSAAPLLSAGAELVATTVRGAHPASFEELGQQSGLVLYEAQLRDRVGGRLLTLYGLGDRAQIFLDGEEIATLDRDAQSSVRLELTGRQARLEILVEAMGRVNFAPELGERKGITRVRLGQRWVHGWSSRAIILDDLSRLPWSEADRLRFVGPVFFRGELNVYAPADTFLGLRKWRKGFAWINGFCLGRYWNKGPHQSLYVPGPLIRAGANEIVMLELHPEPEHYKRPTVAILTTHDFDNGDEPRRPHSG
jgi:beta-galactosidase